MHFYAATYRQFLWPAYEKLRGRHTPELLADAETRQWWPPAVLDTWQREQLAALYRHAERHCPWYRSHPPGSRVLTKAIIREHREELIAGNYFDRVFTHKTGGSTGAPLTFSMTRESYEWRNAMTLRGYGWAGAIDGVRTFFLWALAATPPSRRQRWKTALHDACLRRRIFNSFPLTPERLAQCVADLNRFAPRVLIGYTSLLETLARYIQKHGGLRGRLQSIITAAEGINPAQRELLREVFQAPVFASYGSREFKLIAMECDRGGLHVSADNLHLEITRNGQPAKPGELGQLLVTDLHNYGMPFIRYEIGDLTTLPTAPCPCGRGLPTLGPIQGRVTDVLQTPDGRLISGLFFPHLLKEFAWIDQYQVIQTDRDRLLVKCVPTDPAAADRGRSQLESEIRQVFGADIRVDIEFVADIPRTATGKHRPVISQIPVQI